MRIQEWSRRKLLGLWLVGLGLEAVVLWLPQLQQRRTLAEEEQRRALVAVAVQREADSVAGLPPDLQADYRMRQDSLRRLGLAGLNQIGEGLTSPSTAMFVVGTGILVLIVFGAIPVALLILTLVWYRGQDRGPRGSGVAA